MGLAECLILMKKFNIIALLLFLAAVVAVFTSGTEQSRSVQNWVMNVLSPFIRAGAHAEKQVRDSVRSPADSTELLRQNNKLRVEVERLRILAQEYGRTVEENNKYRSMLNYQSKTAVKLTAASVLRRSSANWWSSLIIDKGTADGIGTDYPVITDIGLVGKTGKVATHSAEIILLTDEECRVSARIEGTQAKGILSGERGGFTTRPDLRLRFLDRTLKVEPGVNVYSTGDGGVFPADILLGKVKVFEAKDVSGEAVIESAVDFTLLEDVFVVHPETPETK